MLSRHSTAVASFWVLTLGLFLATTAATALLTPVDESSWPAQKIFYLHLPVAMNMFAACLVVCVAGFGFLWQRHTWWDDLAAAAAEVVVVFCAVVLLTGMVWAKSAWGEWWTWSPRLTFSLALLVLYLGYLVIRPLIASPPRRAVVCSLYGIAASLDVPLVYLSVKMMPDIHPTSIHLTGPMRLTLASWFVPVSLLMGGLVASRFHLNRRRRALEAADGAAPPATATNRSATTRGSSTREVTA